MTVTTDFDDHAIAPPHVVVLDATVPSALDEYLFDLNGYLLIRGLLSSAEVAEGNARVDAIPRDLPRGGMHGWVQCEDHPDHRGTSYQQIYELGGVFEALIDHRRVINYLLGAVSLVRTRLHTMEFAL